MSWSVGSISWISTSCTSFSSCVAGVGEACPEPSCEDLRLAEGVGVGVDVGCCWAMRLVKMSIPTMTTVVRMMMNIAFIGFSTGGVGRLLAITEVSAGVG